MTLFCFPTAISASTDPLNLVSSFTLSMAINFLTPTLSYLLCPLRHLQCLSVCLSLSLSFPKRKPPSYQVLCLSPFASLLCLSLPLPPSLSPSGLLLFGSSLGASRQPLWRDLVLVLMSLKSLNAQLLMSRERDRQTLRLAFKPHSRFLRL